MIDKNIPDIALGSGALGFSLHGLSIATLMSLTQMGLNIVLALLGCILLVYRIRKAKKETEKE